MNLGSHSQHDLLGSTYTVIFVHGLLSSSELLSNPHFYTPYFSHLFYFLTFLSLLLS
jgi:hypothetical protein